jgi:hypothetical protein
MQSEVNFLQVTVSPNHPVSPRGFLAMFLLVKLLEFSYNKVFSVNFYFVVPEENFSSFKSTEAIYLYYIFNKIQVYVSTITERNTTTSQTNTTPSQTNTTTSQADTTTSQADTTISQTDTTLSQTSTSPSENEIPQGFFYIHLNLFQLSNLNLKLAFNNEIVCDFCNSSVSILGKKFSINSNSALISSNGKIPFVTNDMNTNSLEPELVTIKPNLKYLLNIYSKICFLFQKKKKMNIEEEFEREYNLIENIQDDNTKTREVQKKIKTQVSLFGECSCKMKINKKFLKDDTDVYIFLSSLNLQFDNINIDDDKKKNFKSVFLKLKSRSFNSNISLLQKLDLVFFNLKDISQNSVMKLENYFKKENKEINDTSEDSLYEDEKEEEDEKEKEDDDDDIW